MSRQYINPTFGKVGTKLNKIRKDYGWTLQEVCNKVIELSQEVSKENEGLRAVKLNPSHLSKIEKNEIDTSDYYIALLCEVYQISISDIFKENDMEENVENKTLMHLPPHLKDFVNNDENYYLINVAYNLRKLANEKEAVETIREFLKIINI